MIFCPVGITELCLAKPKWVSYLIGIPKQHSSGGQNFDKAKEKIIKEHCLAFFQGVINYTL